MVNLANRRFGLWILALALAAFLTGCSGGGDGDPNYSTKVNLTPEQKAKIEEEKKNQAPPGTLDLRPGQVRAEPESGMKMPPGKGH